jgi:hypothetical protein
MNARVNSQWNCIIINGQEAAMSTPWDLQLYAPVAGGRTITDLGTYLANNAIFNVKDYGALGDGSDATIAFQVCITALATAGGGTIYVPRGTYAISSGLTLPTGCVLVGDGFGSILSYTAVSGACLTVGTSTTVLNYKNRVSDLAIVLSHIATIGVRLQNTCGAALRDLYIEGPFSNFTTRTNIGVDIDAGNVSTFFNSIDNVLCNHMHIGFKVESTGASYATTQVFNNCSALGDLTSGDTTSVGFWFTRRPVTTPLTGNGEGSVATGGNVEDCGTGILIEGGGVDVLAMRYENNITDVDLTSTSGNNSFSGSSTLVSVTDQGTNNVVELMSDRGLNTFTATLLPQMSGSITLNSGAGGDLCHYAKRGKVVTVWGQLSVASVVAPVGNLLLNTPFSILNDAANFAAVAVRAQGLAATATTALQGYANATGGSLLILEKFAAGSNSPLAGDVQAGTKISFSSTFLIS